MRRRRWVPRVEWEGQEGYAAILILLVVAGIGTCITRNTDPSDTRATAAPAAATIAPAATSAAVARSAPRSPASWVAEFCDLEHDAVATLEPTSLSPTPITRENPFTRRPETVRPRKLTPAQAEAVRSLLARHARSKIRDHCDALDLDDGARLVVVGADDACVDGCKLHARQLDAPRAALVVAIAVAGSMTIGANDLVYVPPGVKSAHDGETYARPFASPEELSKLILGSYTAGATTFPNIWVDVQD